MAKTIFITGATDGIGLETAKRLAADGHKLLLHGRSPAKLQAAQTEVSPEAETYLADLSSLPQTLELADAIRARHSHIDVLINNAGVYRTPQPLTADGLDVRFVVNTVSPYLLTKTLWPLFAHEGRIVNLASAAQAPVDPEALAGRKRLSDMEAYAQSKLALMIWTRALAADHPEGPSVVSVNPGSLLATKMVKEGFGVEGSDLGIGADVLRRAALSEEFTGHSGDYFDNDAGDFGHPHPDALDARKTGVVMKALNALVKAA
ncbi:SDR family NAD(P)-dependent oxidoreductase [uncultured Roseibium sp.]|uniref:SDR family NAD(P)-dependent oxidoreductase n=1 Tax=uncultured Roseibium sp. TaxID=1936171 RepID=UPI002611357F|nr:SDR family NAD(P)-dependent oxidoreductase [uncultured Roseibium sp.]